MRIAIVGAGMAGLSCAGALLGPGRELVLFDKGRRAGGRVATRRAGALSFNHGAQYATARGEGFRAVLDALQAEGAVAPWPAAGEGRRVGMPGMSALPARLATRLVEAGATLRTERHVAHLSRAPAAEGGWALRHLPAAEARPGQVGDAGGEVERFDAVLLALPPPQAAPLLRAGGQADMAAALDPVVVAPCWTLMLAFAAPLPGPDVHRPAPGATDVPPSPAWAPSPASAPPLAWAAREGSRPDAHPGPDRWVANASPAWSRERLEREPAAVAPELLALFVALTGATAAPEHLAAHRWRYALTERPLGRPALWDAGSRIGVCGDWCLDGRVEAAWESGRALAGMLAGSG